MTRVFVSGNRNYRTSWRTWDAPSPTIPAGTYVNNPRDLMVVGTGAITSPMATSPKPPYRVPLMAEIAAAPKCGLRVISTFSGCGGSCLGFEMAGYTVLWANEFIPAAAEVYRLNHPGVTLNTADVRTIQSADLLREAGVETGEVDVMEGSPPCASFSTAGLRGRHWGKVVSYSDTTQRVDDLFFEFVRLVRGVAPKVFVAENVSGLVKGVSKGYFKDILAAMRAAGYRVEARLLNAQWLGVPQARARVIFVGVREDLGKAPAFPAPLSYRYTVRDAIGDLLGGGGRLGTKDGEQTIDRPAPAVLTHGRAKTQSELTLRQYVVHDTEGFVRNADVTDEVAPTITTMTDRHLYVTTGAPIVDRAAPLTDQGRRIALDGYAIGREYDRLRPGEQSSRYLNLVRAREDAPCPTVTQTGGVVASAAVTHPVERRKFTIAELRRVCGFPDDFVLTGTYAQQWERLGRAVPPPMMAAVARVIRAEVFER